jgi:hypothetical protein
METLQCAHLLLYLDFATVDDLITGPVPVNGNGRYTGAGAPGDFSSIWVQVKVACFADNVNYVYVFMRMDELASQVSRARSFDGLSIQHLESTEEPAVLGA